MLEEFSGALFVATKLALKETVTVATTEVTVIVEVEVAVDVKV
jgi:hypothetical protein